MFGGKPWDQSQDRPEEFGFVKIKLECPLQGPLYDARIIFPSGHPTTYLDPYLVEVIAAEIIGGQRVKHGSRCAIHLDHTPIKPRPSSFGEEYLATLWPHTSLW